MDARNNPTLLVFTLGAPAESARRGLLPAGERALETELWEGCLAAVLAAGRSAGCRLEVCSPAPLALPPDARRTAQSGGSFGERLERALADAATRGAGPILVVGTDVPDLTAGHLAAALAALGDGPENDPESDPGRVVLGPSPDGGFYLLACRRPIAGLAGAARWRSPDTLRGLLRSLREAGRPVTLLAPLCDLDRRADLERWLAGRPAAGHPLRLLAQRLGRLLAGLRRPPRPACLGAPSAPPAAAVSGRAPPLFAAH
jgi:hypothetical protein